MSDYLTRTDTFIASLGLEAYRVGGSVRDEILGRRAKDADYMIRGEGLNEVFRRLHAKNHGIERFAVTPLKLRDGRQGGWRVAGRGLGVIEIVLPRTEVPRDPKPGENRHRAFEIVVDPDVTLVEDAKRRDFTFNALYKIITRSDGLRTVQTLPDGRVVEDVLDPTGDGLDDLYRNTIRTTHPDSFRDDPLRTLRALRFVARGFSLSDEARNQMVAHSSFVTGLSANGYASGTVLDELSKILMGDNAAAALRIARDTGVLGTLIPEIEPMLGFDQGSRYHDLTTDEHTFKALETAAHVDAPLRVRMALLFHDAGKPESAWVGEDGRKHYYASEEHGTEDHEVVGEWIWRAVSARLNAPKGLRDDVATLIRAHMVPCYGHIKPSKVRRMRAKFGDEMLRDLLLHRACDISGKGGGVNRNHLQAIAKMERVRQEAEAAKVPASIKDLEVTGHDAAALGLHGVKIGQALRSLLHEVVSEPTETHLSREWQLASLKRLAG